MRSALVHRLGWLALLIGLFTFGPRSGQPHGFGAAAAWPTVPDGVGEVVDQSYEISWSDSDSLGGISTASASISWFFVSQRPPTFPLGLIPDGLDGELIASDIPESDLDNQILWNTSTVAPGSYYVYSRIIEPAASADQFPIIAFSRGVVTIAHPGDPIFPAVIVTSPVGTGQIATGPSTTLRFEAFDPDGSASIDFDAFRYPDTDALLPIAHGVDPSASGELTWEIGELPEGDYGIRAKITDARGLSFTGYSPFLLIVDHEETTAPLDEGDLEETGCSCRGVR